MSAVSVDRRRRRTGTRGLAPWPSLWRASPPPPPPSYESTLVSQQWLGRAACRDGSVDMFPEGDTAGVDAAHAVCAGCPVQEACAVLFVSLPPAWREHGVWAGSTPNRRRTEHLDHLGSTPLEGQTDRGAR